MVALTPTVMPAKRHGRALVVENVRGVPWPAFLSRWIPDVRISIGTRLFLAMLLAIGVLTGLGGALIRWTLREDTATPEQARAREPLDRLEALIAAQYREHHDWSFLPAEAAPRRAWLREALVRAEPGSEPSLAYRLALLDRDRRLLSGAVASAPLVAIASIDTRARRLVVDGQPVGTLLVARPQTPADGLAVAFLIDQQTNLLIVTALGLLLSAIAAAVLATGFRRPILQLVAGARRLEAARYDTRLPGLRRDELGELAVAFNHLAARLEGAEASRRQWVIDTSHELRTPLAVLRGQLEALADGIRPASPENLALLIRHADSLTRRVGELSELARADLGTLQYEKTRTQVWPLVSETFGAFAQRFAAAGLHAELAAAPRRSTVDCDAERIRQVLTNLFENCVRYVSPGGRIAVSGLVTGEELRVYIDDSAPGVSGTDLARLGERFFRTDAARARQVGGAGIGLSLCRQIATAHGGALEFGASPLGGLRVTLMLKLEA